MSKKKVKVAYESLRPAPEHFPLSNLPHKVEEGYIVIPQFQRDFVWKPEDTASLFDSILKGFPIGTFTFWNTRTRLRMIKNLGGVKFDIAKDGNVLSYVLDGQQRITSIYACVEGLKIDNVDYGNIYLRLSDELVDDQLVVYLETEPTDGMHISIRDLFNGGIDLCAKYKKSHHEKISYYHNVLREYPISTISIPNAPIEVATDIFTRINTTGKKLTSFEILCAKVYKEGVFDLIEKRDEQKKDWEEKNFDVPDMTVMEAMSLCVKGVCSKTEMLKLTVNDFISNWDKVNNAFELAIDHFKGKYGIPASKLLPYDVLMVPFVYYFFKKEDGRMTSDHARLMVDYFWRNVLTSNFADGVVSKMEFAAKVVDCILAGKEHPRLPVVDISENAIRRDGVFSLTSAYAKGVLCLLAAQGPLTFDTGTKVQMGDAWISQSNSVNYHHFFPKAYMAKHCPKIDADDVNHVVNITIVDRYLNQKKIKARAPSDYIADYKGPKLKKILATHLIGDLTDFGITKNDYNKFFKRRVALFQKELKKRLIRQPGDVLQ